MAFPGIRTIDYYKGDTYEFRVYPKNSDGSAFSLANYSVSFAFAQSRGSAGTSTYHEAHAEIIDNLYVLCAIRPGDAKYLNAGTTYVYDVEITKTASPYSQVHTILTGNINVTDQITVVSTVIDSIYYTVTYTADNTTYGSVPIDRTQYVQDQTLVLKSPINLENPGHTFVGWNDGVSTYEAGETYKIGSSNVIFSAEWQAIP